MLPYIPKMITNRAQVEIVRREYTYEVDGLKALN